MGQLAFGRHVPTPSPGSAVRSLSPPPGGWPQGVFAGTQVTAGGARLAEDRFGLSPYWDGQRLPPVPPPPVTMSPRCSRPWSPHCWWKGRSTRVGMQRGHTFSSILLSHVGQPIVIVLVLFICNLPTVGIKPKRKCADTDTEK